VSRLDVERFVADVREARREAESQRAVEEVLARAVADAGAIVGALGEPAHAGIHPLHRAPDLTVLNVIWAPHMVLLPHEHAMWASIGIYGGREDNIVWRRRGPTIEATGATAVREGEVFGLADDAIHSVVNPTRRRTGAIHIYGGDFFGKPRSEWDPETLRERPFDVEAAQRLHREAEERFAKGG
jgi:predicted metal-dependent enzyme (double-stranded beta helix superfamily)